MAMPFFYIIQHFDIIDTHKYKGDNMGFKDWAKRVQKEVGISKEEIAAAIVIEMGDQLDIGEVTFTKSTKKMSKKMHDEIKERETKYGRGAFPKIVPKSIKVNTLEQPIPKFNDIEIAFREKIVYSKERTLAKAALTAAKAQWTKTNEGIATIKKGEYVEVVYENGTTFIDNPERSSHIISMMIANATSLLNKINNYAPIQQNRRTAGKHVDLSFNSLKGMFKKRRR